MADNRFAKYATGTPDVAMLQTDHGKPNRFSKYKELQWSDVPGKAVENAPASAARFAENVVYPILHPIETLTALKDIGVGLGSKAIDAIGIEQAPQDKERRQAAADAVGKFIADRYGSVEAFKKTLAEDPVGALADASLVLTGGAAVPARLPGAAGQAARAVGRVGSAIDPIVATGRGISKAGKIVPDVIGMTTGAGGKSYRDMFAAGEAGNTVATKHLRDMDRSNLSEPVDMAERALGGLIKDRSADYNAGMQGVRTSTAHVPVLGIHNLIRQSLNSVQRGGFVKDPKALKVIEDADAMFANLMQLRGGLLTIEDLDDFKQALYNASTSLEQGSNAQRVARNMSNAVKDEIIKVDPQYAKTMADYSSASDKIGEMRRTLSINDKASTDTTLRKLQSSTRDNVNTNFGARTRLVDDLAKYEPDLPYALAGQSLASWAPRGLARMGSGMAALSLPWNPTAIYAAPFVSPRVMGEASYAMGRGVGAAKRGAAATGLDKIPPSAIPAGVRALRQAGAAEHITEPLRGSVGPGDRPLSDEEKQILLQQLSR